MAGPRLRGQPIMLKSALSGGDLIQLLISQIRSAVQLQEALPVSIRRLRVDDIDQVVTIEKEAFSPLWVSSSFKRELNNKRANYLVACFDEDVSPEEILTTQDVTVFFKRFTGYDFPVRPDVCVRIEPVE